MAAMTAQMASQLLLSKSLILNTDYGTRKLVIMLLVRTGNLGNTLVVLVRWVESGFFKTHMFQGNMLIFGWRNFWAKMLKF